MGRRRTGIQDHRAHEALSRLCSRGFLRRLKPQTDFQSQQNLPALAGSRLVSTEAATVVRPKYRRVCQRRTAAEKACQTFAIGQEWLAARRYDNRHSECRTTLAEKVSQQREFLPLFQIRLPLHDLKVIGRIAASP